MKILSLKSIINLGLNSSLLTSFPTVELQPKPIYIPSTQPLNPNWISGFTAGDGSLHISISSSSASAIYSFGLNIRDKSVLTRIQNFFGFGQIYVYTSTNVVE